MSQKFIAWVAILCLLMLIIPASFADNLNPLEIGEAEDDTPADEFIRSSNTTQVDVIGEIKTFMGLFESDDDEILVQILDLSAGDTIYAYAAGVGLVDTYMYLLDESMGKFIYSSCFMEFYISTTRNGFMVGFYIGNTICFFIYGRVVSLDRTKVDLETNIISINYTLS